MTEFCPMLDEPREQDMLGLAHIMQIGFTDGNLSGYIAWQLFWGYHAQFIGVCPGSGWDLDGSGKYVCKAAEIKVFPEYHAMRHYSKFVNPGWYVVGSTTDGSDLHSVAFRSAAGDSLTVVAINKANATSLNFAVEGYTPVYAVQSVENGDKSKPVTAAATLEAPAKSITTVVFTSSSSAIKGIRANLAANDMNAEAKVFDMNGNLLWTGIKNQALNADGSLRLDLRKGMYIVKTKASTVKATK